MVNQIDGIHRGDDFTVRRRRIGGDESGRLHDLTGLAVTALRHLGLEPGLLHRMPIGVVQALDGGDHFTRHVADRDLA
jgi:hypothetical protein